MIVYKTITVEVELDLTYKTTQIVDTQNSTPDRIVYRTAYDLVKVVPLLDEIRSTNYIYEDN